MIVDKFHTITQFNLQAYFDQVADFIRNDRRDVVEYYSGVQKTANSRSFKVLDDLLSKSNQLDGLIDNNSDRMSGEFWSLIETIDQVKQVLITTSNASKWMRSIITKNNFNPDIQVENVLSQFQTLENLSASLGSNNNDNDWPQMMFASNLLEEDYTTQGGAAVLSTYRNKLKIDVKSVVDNIDQQKIYGRDFAKKLSFADEDIAVLSYENTVKQAVKILADLRAGATPEFPYDGIQASIVSGVSKASIPYPVLMRQLYSTFAKDDTLKSLRVTNIDINEDSLSLSFEITTRIGEVKFSKTTI